MRLSLLFFLLFTGCDSAADDIARNLSSDNPVVREDSAKVAKNFGTEEVVQALIEALSDPSEDVRLNALSSLAELSAVAAVPAILQRLEVETSAPVKRQIVDALGRLQDERAVPTLISYIETSPSDSPPLDAIWALGFIGNMDALPLLSSLRDSSDPYVSWNATVALKNLRP